MLKSTAEKNGDWKMKAVYVGEHPEMRDNRKSIFLAGPSPRNKGDYHWRPDALKILEQRGYPGDIFVPLLENGDWLGNYEMQMDWELQYLAYADVIAFWIPRDIRLLPGFTTNIEFGYYVRSGKIVLGYPADAPKMRYLHRLAERHEVPVVHSLENTIDEAIIMAFR